MDELNATLVLAFLQADRSTSGSSDYDEELLTLADEVRLLQQFKSKSPRIDDGDLETDGHLLSNIAGSLEGVQPTVDLWPRDRAEACHQVAEELRQIGAQLEREVVARGVRNLSSRISVAPPEEWRHHLVGVVERAMREGVGLEHLPQERVLMALTLTLVRGVCVEAPRLLRGLFSAAVQMISPPGAR
ncbi:unnamed protein product [Ophioblennius macclurei]